MRESDIFIEYYLASDPDEEKELGSDLEGGDDGEFDELADFDEGSPLFEYGTFVHVVFKQGKKLPFHNASKCFGNRHANNDASSNY